jgi:hypothetical protein
MSQSASCALISAKPVSCQLRVGPHFKLIGGKPVREPPLLLVDLTAAGKRSHVVLGQHLGGAFVQLFRAPHLLETRQ